MAINVIVAIRSCEDKAYTYQLNLEAAAATLESFYLAGPAPPLLRPDVFPFQRRNVQLFFSLEVVLTQQISAAAASSGRLKRDFRAFFSCVKTHDI